MAPSRSQNREHLAGVERLIVEMGIVARRDWLAGDEQAARWLALVFGPEQAREGAASPVQATGLSASYAGTQQPQTLQQQGDSCP